MIKNLNEPLSFLKEFILENKPIYIEKNQVVFGDIKFESETKCFDKDNQFLLSQILFYLKNSTLKFSEYVALCKRSNQVNLSLKQQNSLNNYLFPKGVKQVTILERKQEEKQEEIIQEIDENQYKQFKSFINSFKNETIPFKIENYSNFIEQDRILLSKQKQVEIDQIPKKIFEKVLFWTREIKKEEKIRKQKKIQESLSSNKGKFNEKTIWNTNLGTSELDEFQIDTKGSIISSSTNNQKVINQPIIKTPSNQSTKKEYPIIIVPSSLTSCLTIYNAKQLLEKENYKSTEEMKNTYKDKPNAVIIHCKMNKEKMQEIMVIDDPLKLSKKDWERVIAIFTNGQTWQFKDWPLQNPTDLFTKYKGFYLHFDDEPVKTIISQWPVKVLKISRHETKRYTDHLVVCEIWKNL